MTHPVLRIKKGAAIYDDTEARHAAEVPRPALPGSGPLRSRRRGKRGIPLTFFPLLVVALGLFILFRVVPNTPIQRSVVSGWQVTLRVTPYQDSLIVGVTFIASVPEAVDPANAPKATVRLSLPGTGEQVFIVGGLDKSPMTLRSELPWPPNAKRVSAEVRIGSARAALWVPVP
jgi:hypothetical protein